MDKPERPQDSHPELLLRARQLNFGYIHNDSNPKEEEIRDWKPTRDMLDISEWYSCSDTYGTVEIKSEEDFKLMMEWLDGSTEIGLDIEYQSRHTLKGN